MTMTTQPGKHSALFRERPPLSSSELPPRWLAEILQQNRLSADESRALCATWQKDRALCTSTNRGKLLSKWLDKMRPLWVSRTAFTDLVTSLTGSEEPPVLGVWWSTEPFSDLDGADRAAAVARAVTRLLSEPTGSIMIHQVESPASFPPHVMKQAFHALCRVHDRDYLDRLSSGGGRLWDALFLSTAMAVDALGSILAEKTKRAFVGVRFPGHDVGTSGNELVNVGAAMAALALLRGQPRVLLIDTNSRYGHGTEEIVVRTPGLYYVSIHATGIGYPCSHETDEELLDLYPQGHDRITERWVETYAWPALCRFARRVRPHLIILQTGFDCGRDDPNACASLSPTFYRVMAQRVASLSESLCQGRVLSVLEEGGVKKGNRQLNPLSGCLVHHMMGLATP